MKKNYLQKIATSILLVFICLGINGQINADVLTTNVSCYGGNDGTAWIENLTGTSPYSYLWSTGFTGDSITGLSVGNYSVEISDNNLDTINLSFDILEPDPISIISTVTNETQAIGNDGAIDITVSGGNPPYTFGWSNGASTEDVSSLQAGTYNLTVLDVDSCSLIDTFIVAYQNPNPLTATGIITDIPCYGYCNGYIDISVSGGNSPYSFIWSNGAMSEDVFTMCAGACSVTITDSNPDTVNLSFYILQPDPINIVPTVSHVTSAGNNNGTIDLTISGGTSPYNFAWSNGATTEDLSNLVVGTYMITITDANSCFYYDIFTVSFINPPPSLSVSGIINDVTCSGDCDGGIDLTVTGGLSPYTINWASGETTEDLSYLCPGIYEVTVSSAAGSVAPMPWTYVGVPNYSNWFSGGVYVNSNPADEGDFLGAFYLENGNFVCAGYDEVDSIGGANLLLIPDDITSPQKDGFVNGDFIYMKLWRISDGSILEITPVFGYGWACGQTFCNGGSSWVDFYGSYYPPSYSPLTSTVIFELAQPDPLIIDPAITQVDTFVNTNGAIDLTVSGGVSPYSFAWSNGDTTEDINNLDTGIYWLTLSDVNNCELYDSFIVDYADIYLSLAMMKQDADCYGLSTGSVWVDVLVGVSPFTFLWSNGMTADSIFGLSAGVYSLTATAANGDSCINTITIFQPDTISIGAIITSATTTVGNDGAIDLTISGGTSPYAVLWSNGAVTEDISQLIPGTYNLIISDANSCNYTDSFEVNLFSPLFTTGNSSNIDCYGICNGTVNLTVSGGNTPYNFIWSNGETSEDISNLCAGNYTATISDQNTVNFLVMPWNYTNTGINHTILIQAGVLTLDGASIQTGDYVGVFYNDNGNYQCGGYCLWNNNSSVNAVTAWGDDPGPGKVGFDVGEAFTWKVWRQTDGATVVMDPSYSILFPHLGNFITNGMSGFETLIGNTINVLTLSFDILEPDSINIISTVTNETQTIGNDGAIDITVSGGTPPYNYSWSNGAASEDISSLVTGTFGLTVMDANFCSYAESLVVGFDSAVSLFATGAVTDILCYGYCNGAIDLTVSGGYLPYSFIWSNGEITEDVSNLCANFYSVTIIDSNLDTISLSFDILEPDSISIISTVTNETQTIGNDGAIDITVSGGTPPYNYSWSNGAASEDISSLVTGTYGLTVMDANFCSYVESLVVGFDSAVTLFATGAVTDILCYGDCNGAIDLTVSAGNSPYSFIWSNGEITEDVSNLCANFYSVTISDSNLDTINLSFDILQPDHIVISSIITNETFSIGNDGEIDLTVSGGTPPYSFSWSNGVTNEDIDSLSAGYYSVTITDANYCLGIDSFEVDLLAFLGNVFHANSPLFNDGYIELFGGDSLTNPVSFSWSNGATTKNIFNLSPGIYTVTYTDAFNQSGSVSFEVGVTNMDYPFPWFVASSTLAHTIHIPGGNAVTIKGQLLMPGDKVGVFYDSLGYWACGGFIEWNGNPQNITIYGDTIGNAGFDLNEQFRFIVRSQLYNRDFIAEPTFDLSGSYSNDSLFSIGGISGLLSLEADSLILQSVLLWEGFNWFYTTYPIVDPHPINVFSAAVGSLELLKSQYLQIYWPAYGLCGFSSIDTGLIYQAFMNNTDVIQFPCILSDNVLYQINTNTCYNVPDGFIEINSSFGVPPYSYIWNTGATANTITNIPPNTNYSVTVTDALLVQQSLNLTSGSGNEYPVLNFDITNATSTMGGSAEINTYWGGSCYWSTGDVGNTIINQPAGIYNLTVENGMGCLFDTSITITYASFNADLLKTDISCNGLSDGSAWLDNLAGVSPYSFLWSTGFTGDSISGLSEGNYTVTIIDNAPDTVSLLIEIFNPPVIEISQTITLNTGTNNGAIDITVSGGTPPYSFTWSNGATTEDISSLPDGTYFLTVVDVNLCPLWDGFIVNYQPSTLAASGIITDVDCNGHCNGAINLTATDGNPPYSFIWLNGEITEDVSNLCAGAYSVTISDSNLDTLILPFEISQPDSISISSAITNETQASANDGSIDINISGGTPPYSFSWSNGATTEDLTGLSSGSYLITLSDANLCDAIESYVVGLDTTGNLIVADSITDILCYGDCNGAIDLTVTGGNTPYSYFWSNSETSEDISGLCAGSYFVNVFESGSTQPGNAWPWSYTNTGANHTILIPPGSISLNGSPPPIGSIIGVFYDDAGVLKCGGYTVWTGLQSAISAWADDTSTPDKDGFSSGEAFNWQIYANGVSYIMSAQYNSGFPNMGNYITNGMSGVLSLNSAAGGFNSFSYTVLQADEIIVNANISPVNPGIGNNGAIDLTISGGTPPYVFLWSNSATSEDLSALNIGTYILSLTDANQCTIVDTFEVSTQVVGALAASAAIGNTFCYGDCNGEIDLSVSGGISPYEYIWSTGETTGFIDSLCAGNYSVTINDQITASFPTMPWTYTNTGINHTILIQTGVVTIDGDSIQIGDYVGVFYDDNGTLECGGYSVWTSSLSIAVSAWGDDSSTSFKDGFDPGESFNWKVWRQADSAIIDMTPTYLTVMPNQGNFTTNGMSGLEILTGSSNNSLIENYVVTQPDSIILNSVITHADSVIGNNGAIDLTISGGVSPYSILWSNGETTEDIDSLVAGTYFLTLTDANSCVETSSYTINSLSQISLSFGSTAVSATGASDGTAWVIVSGGVSPYQYQWDFSAINNDTIFNLESHYYHVTVTDAVNNQAMGQVYVSGGLLELSIGVNLAGETGASDGLCYAYPYGGTPPFTYIWSTGETTDSISGLPAGTYALTITDNLSIQATSEATIYNLANRIWIEFISAPVTTTLASDGSIDISCSGGIPPYTYSWSTGATTEDLMNLAEGLYQVWVTDNTGITDSSFIYVGSDQALDWSFINTGSSHVVVVYDTIPKSFNWNQVDTGDYIGVFYEDNGSLHCCGYNVYNATTMSIMACGDDYTTGQKDGYYTSDAFIWFIHDASENRDYNVSAMYMETSPYFNHFFINGISVPSRIGDPTPAFDLAVTAIISPQNHCDFNGLFNVSIEISNLGTNTASNFTVSFMMQNGTVLMEMVPMAILPSDTYIHTFFILFDGSVYEFEENLSITAFVMCTNDANPGNDTLTIDYPNTFPYFSLQNDVLGNCIGSISIDSVFNNSGSQPDFFWGNTSYGNNMFIDSLCAGNYTFFINDSICTDSFIFEIEDEPLMIQFNSNPPTCNGMLDGNIDAVLNYAPGTNYSYLWSTGDTTSSISGLGGGMYILTVSQNSTYLISDTVELLDPPLLYFTGSVQNSSAAGLQDGAIDVTVTGGIPPYSYLWSNGATSEDLLNIGMGNFIVSVSDANLCELVDSFSVISLGSTLSFDFSTIAADCYGSATGSAWISNLIGVAPFSFIWSNGATTDSISGLPAGNYSVTVFAGNGDIVSNNIDVLQPDEILVNFVVLPVDPAIGNDGAIDLTPSGGTSPYSFAWSTGATTEDIGNLVYGQYSLTLTDANSCQLTASFMVEYSGIYLSFDMVAQDADCYGASTGSAWISNLTGVAPFSFIWSNGAGTDSIFNLPAGNYSVTVFAGNGDIVSNNIDVLQPGEILVNFVVSMADPILMSDGAIDITVSGGTSPYSYLWSDGSTNEDLSSAPYGSYQLTVSDANLCELSVNTFVDFNVLPNWDFNLSGTTHSIDIPATALLQLNGVLLETNDFIGVFYDSLGSLSCGGYVVWQQNSTTLLAYGDNPATTNPDGFANAEEFEWIIWDVSNNMEHFAAASYNSAYPNQQYWQANGQSGLDSLQTVTISGTVSTTTKSNLPLGMIVLYEPIQNSYYAVEKGLVTNGQWEIEGVLPGNYLIYAIPVAGYDYGIPGYFVQRKGWQDASLVHANAYTGGIDITIDPVLPYATGAGAISGNIYVGSDASYNPDVFGDEWFSGSTKADEVPARNIPILLFNNQMTPLDFRLSNELGAFEFGQVELGTYFVKVEKAGLHSDSIEITLTAQNPISDGINFSLEEGHVISVPELIENDNFIIYPNPVSEKLFIRLKKQASDFELKLMNIAGQEIHTTEIRSSEGKLITIDMKEFVPGIYFIEISNIKSKFIHKLIKVE